MDLNKKTTYKLVGVIEIDDSFFGGSKEGGDKRGRGEFENCGRC